MRIKSDEQLKEIIAKINEDIQEVCKYIGPDDPDKYDGKEYLIKIPRGYIRKVEDHEKELAILNDLALKKNISYNILLTDFYCLILNRTDIFFTLREMIIKNGIIIYSSIMESLLRVEPFKNIKPKQSFPKRIERIKNIGLIDDELKEELLWLWNVRGNIHLYLLEKPEFTKYSDKDYNKAANVVMKLLNHINSISVSN